MERWQLSAPAVTIVPFKDSITSSFGTAVISLDFASVATCASTMCQSARKRDPLSASKRDPGAAPEQAARRWRSVSSEAAWRYDRLELGEIQIADRLQCFGKRTVPQV